MVFLQQKVSSRRKPQVMSQIQVDHCEHKLPGSRQKKSKTMLTNGMLHYVHMTHPIISLHA
jgi:hypothetical protein